MTRSDLRLVITALLPVAMLGCDSQEMARREPLMQAPLRREALDPYYEPMFLNAAAHNMALSDGHFVPHTDELNSLGAEQLNRMCLTLERHSGTVRYETRSLDEDMVAARIKSIEQYLTDTGLDMTHITVAPMLSGGRSVLALDAINAKYKALAAGGDAKKAQAEKK